MPKPMNSALLGLESSAIRRFTALAKETPGCLLLTLGEPEADTPRPVREAAAASLLEGDTHYPPNNGQPWLREGISRFEAERGIVYRPEEVLVTCGATEGIFCALTALLNPGDEVIVPIPAFGLYQSIIGLCRGRMIPLSTGEFRFQLDGEALRRAVTPRTKALILTSPNNPTGCVYSRESLAAAAQVAEETGIWVICDDVYSQLVYQEGYRPFAALYPRLKEQTVVVDSFSKPYAMTGWRLGWLMADGPAALQMAKVHQYATVSVTSFTQRAALEALRWDPAPLREIYRRRRDLACRRLKEMGMEVVEPQGAFYLFPSIRRWGMDSETFCTRLIREGGVALVPGSCFGAEGYVRLSYCCDDRTLEEGLNRLEAFLGRCVPVF